MNEQSVSLLAHLNEQQRAAVEPGRGVFLVRAGAGSGKTRVITRRIAHLIAHHKAEPSSIVALTFTNKAANEMKERVAQLAQTTTTPAIGTFHAYCLRLLKTNRHLLALPDFTIMDEDDRDKLIQKIVSAAGKEAWAKFKILWNRSKENHDTFIKLCKERDDFLAAGYSATDQELIDKEKQMIDLLMSSRQLIGEMDQVTGEMMSVAEINFLESQIKKEKDDSATKFLIVIMSLISVGVTLAFSIFFPAAVTRPVIKLSKELKASADKLSSETHSLSSVSTQLSSSSSQQAAGTQESVAAMTEMESMINHTTDYSQQSKLLVSTIREKTTVGDEAMHELADSMDGISKSNVKLVEMQEIIKDIDNKTKVINDIVFKTQLLSFNASIEAARAGQHGKGFAVVAEEVGKLAQMSGEAATQIKELLENSQKEVASIVETTKKTVSQGQSTSEKALRIFKEIFEGVDQVVDKIAQIASASSNQQEGIKQTGKAMSELDKAITMNVGIADTVMESARRLESVSDLINTHLVDLQQVILGKK